MITRLAILLGLLLASAPSAAELQQTTLVFIGSLDSTRLIRRTGLPPSLCDSSGQCYITIDNSCGTEEAHFQVLEVLAGPHLPDVTVTATVGEWCTPPLPKSRRPVLVWVTRHESVWLLERVEMIHVEPTGARVIAPDEDGTIASVPLSSIRRPLTVPILHSRVGDFPAERIRYLVQQGIVEVSGTVVNYRSAVSVEDLAGALRSNNRLERSGEAPAAQPER